MSSNSDKGTSNIDLQNMAKQLKIPNFLGVFMNDEVHKLSNQKLNDMSFIVNFHDSNDYSVGHWTAVICHKGKKFYFDPYGCEIPDTIRKLLGTNIIRSDYQIQNYNTYSCGEFCILVIYLIVLANMTYEDVILTMLDVVDNYNEVNGIVDRVGE